MDLDVVYLMYISMMQHHQQLDPRVKSCGSPRILAYTGWRLRDTHLARHAAVVPEMQVTETLRLDPKRQRVC